MLLIDLNGKWQMKKIEDLEWIDASVPGSVYNDYLKNGKISDPFYRENEYNALELSNHDYEYERYFTVTEKMFETPHILLNCKGLDTICEILINKNKVLSSNNMHRNYEVDIKSFLIKGENLIQAIFRSPVKYVLKKQKEFPLTNSFDAIEGISHLRKAHYMFGWDWGPKLPDMGIWRDISIDGYDVCRFDDIYITQIHKDGIVDLDVRTRISGLISSDLVIDVALTSPEGNVSHKRFTVSDKEMHCILNVIDPKLWWPNNLGAQPLYTVKIALFKNGIKIDENTFRTGLRTLTVKRETDQWGESFEFNVNGLSFFSMGADYIPEDNILSRCNRNRTEALIKSCVKANYNTIRVWGGAYYPEDYFYDLCDEYGLVVWQDMMFACGIYRLTDEFKETITHEVTDNMKRLRHHASLGLWCGNNEQEWGWVEWGWSENFSPSLKADYIKQFEVLLPQIAKETDPNTFYWLASPSSFGSFDRPNDENFGDMHYWGVWHKKRPFTDYRTIYPRYMSEFGLQSFPSMKTIETFTLPDDRNIFSPVMESHQKCNSGNLNILHYISENYKYPKDFDSLMFASQLIQAEGLRYGVEHWRRNRGRCMGAIYWQLNDCWPVASWASIDYFGRWKALHYAAKKFFAPVLASACEDGTSVSLHVSNETFIDVNGVLIWKLIDRDSNIISTDSILTTINAFTSKEVLSLNIENELDTIEKKRTSYLEYAFEVNDKAISSGTVLFVKSKHFNFADPQLEFSVTEEADTFSLLITSKAFAKFVALELESDDVIFSDNYFDLSADKEKTVEISKSDMSQPLTLEELSQQLKIRSLYDTY
jgi:beta-mannosidase